MGKCDINYAFLLLICYSLGYVHDVKKVSGSDCLKRILGPGNADFFRIYRCLVLLFTQAAPSVSNALVSSVH